MKRREAEKIAQMVLSGIPPSKIAAAMDMSVNTIKSHIRRHPEISFAGKCLFCGVPVVQPEGRKKKKFCSDRCRISYWNHCRKENHHDRNKAS